MINHDRQKHDNDESDYEDDSDTKVFYNNDVVHDLLEIDDQCYHHCVNFKHHHYHVLRHHLH